MKIKITEDRNDIMFQHNGEIVLENCDAQKIGETLFACREVSDVSDCIKQIANIGNIEESKPLLRRTCYIEVEDADGEEEAYRLAGEIFIPQFKTNNLTVTKVSLFTEVNEKNYGVEYTYNFEKGLKIEITKFINSLYELDDILDEIEIIMEDIVKGVELCAYPRE